ncbi:hypothetical protein PPSIR1_17580 [Plesiocystis pacifica SIR-1]|uniref:DUF4440 domain-containing protein n=1 Tax=Plesiocystis pacifica SIR-1 TaxID=391625 RepID=A6GIV7_9BACT|nr:nuclear transport factor 2 family protein [Plesiocystis pacifica]EDM74192.1 hypothetical protein PPSIR1_17580 [Plesiocystis pacifica SIR-1]
MDNRDDDVAKIEALHDAWIAAAENRDAEAYISMLTPDVELICPGVPEPIRGREAYAAMLSGAFTALHFPCFPSSKSGRSKCTGTSPSRATTPS